MWNIIRELYVLKAIYIQELTYVELQWWHDRYQSCYCVEKYYNFVSVSFNLGSISKRWQGLGNRFTSNKEPYWWFYHPARFQLRLREGYGRGFHKLSKIQECQYFQIRLSCTIRKELDQWHLQSWNINLLHPLISHLILTNSRCCK